MSAVQYPFIDIAAHQRVRTHFAAGKALVLFSRDMGDVLWANGRGAQLFGRDSVYDVIDQGPARADLTFRQMQATARQLKTAGESRSFVMRMTSGFQRVAVNGLCECIRLANGEEAILIVVPAGDTTPLPADSARQMLEGLDEPGMHMAVLDGDGALISTSTDFDRLKLTPQTARMLVTLAENDRDRLVKRPVPTAIGYLPGAIARLSDDPALSLLLLVEADAAAPADPDLATEEKQLAPLVEPVSAEPPATADVPAPEATFAEAIDAVSAIADLEDEAVEETEFAALTADVTEESDAPTVELDEPMVAKAEPAMPAVESVETTAAEAPEVVDEPLADAGQTEEPEPVEATPAFGFRRETRATRFVWKIDADGRFSEVSPELAASVGPHAAQVVGLAFTDVAALFNLDPENKIGELLSRRDTWSGKTIWWPVEGTDLQVPIDLAALPTYTRNRDFDGFRGFGIVRIADVQDDPLAVGLTLVPQPEATPEPENEPDDELVEDDVTVSEAEGFSLPEEPETPAAIADAEAQAPAGEDAPTDEAAPATPAPLAPPAVEKPVLRIVDNPGQRHSDKVIRFDERRTQMPTGLRETARDGLSPGEQAAFREIARRLDVFRRGDDTQAETASGTPVPVVVDEPDAAATAMPESPELTLDDATDADTASEGVTGEIVAEEAAEVVEEDALPREDRTGVDEPVDAPLYMPAADAPEAEDAAPTAEADASAEESATVLEPAAPEEIVESAEPVDPAPVDEEISSEPQHMDIVDEAEPESEATEIVATDAPIKDEPALDLEEEIEAAADLVMPATEEVEDAVAVEDDRISLEEAYAQAIPMRARPELSVEIIDQMPVALLVHTGETLIHGNPEFLRLTGYDSIKALAEVGGLDALLQRQDLEDKTADAGGMVVVRADDAIVPVSARLQSVRWEHASALILALMPMGDYARSAPAIVEPDTAAVAETERQAEELSRLSIEVEELRSILDTATDGVVIIDMNGEIRSMNRAASALFNYDNAETSGKPFVMLFAHESQKSVLDYLSGLAGHGVASLLNDGREVIGREASGGFLPLFMTIGHLTSSNGYCAVIRDITQWKRTEEELRNAKRAAETANAHKSDFLAHVSHEIRTPLNAIIGFADMMATERLGPIGHARYVEYANDIGRSGRHVLDIVNDLLDISKIEAGEMELDFAAVGLNETVAEAVSLVQPQANGQRVIIRTALSQSVPPVVADLRSIKQIVLNILSNAIRFTPSGGQIVVSTAYEANGNVVLRIRDTGIGMTRPELELAMQPFRQVAGAARKRGDGTGLGLPLTKAMVDANRASFSIHSAPNEGTLVEVTFPSPRVLAN
jgi:PAS domain S-box-containing protein